MLDGSNTTFDNISLDVMKRLMSHNAQKLYELLPNEWAKAQKAQPKLPNLCQGGFRLRLPISRIERNLSEVS